MKVRLLFLLLLPICMWTSGSFAQSSQSKKTPLEFNDELVSVTTRLYELGKAWGTQFAGTNAGDKDFSQLAPYRRKLTDFISERLTSIKQLKSVGVGGEALKKAMLDFLVFEEEMLFQGFVPMEKLTKQSTDEDIKKAAQKLTELADKEGEMLEKVNQEQERYAKANGFTLEGKNSEGQ